MSNYAQPWNDFNDAEQQQSFDLIPRGTAARVRMSIKPGGHDNPEMGWTGGWASESFETGAVYLSCEFVVMEGPFAKRKVWSNIGLHSTKGPTWANMGRTFVRAALNSARNIHPADNSPQAQNARRIAAFGDLDGLEFAVRIDIEKDGRGEDKNSIKSAIEPDHKDYALVMGVASKSTPSGGGSSGSSSASISFGAPATVAAPSTTPPAAPAVAVARAAQPTQQSVPGGKPAWAQ